MEKDPVIAAQEKEIARFLATLPSEVLKNQAKTSDQRLYWDIERSFQELLSECWIAYFEGSNDPLRPRLNSGELARDEYNFIWRTTDFYLKLWGLIQVSFEQIQPVLVKAEPGKPSSSALNLFREVVKEQADTSFSTCLELYYVMSVSELIKLRRLRKKIDSGKATLSDSKEFAALLPKDEKFPLLWLVLKACRIKAARHERIMRERLEDTHVALERLSDSINTMCRCSGSYVWKNGKLLRGQKKGGTYTET